MIKLYEALFRHGVTMIVRPEFHEYEYEIEFIRDDRHYKFFVTSKVLDDEVFELIIIERLKRFIDIIRKEST